MRITFEEAFSLFEISDICHGRLNSRNALIYAITTDTRECEAGDLFIALKGEKYDGHFYLSYAHSLGAFTLGNDNAASVWVKNSYDALLSIATLHKKRIMPKYTVAITGSVGKTTTKNFAQKMLSHKHITHKTMGNYNNAVGLAHTVLTAKKRTEILVCELGMNHKNEIKALSEAISPTISVITNVGSAHIGNLGSRENIAMAKLEIECGMSGGPCIIPDNEPLLLKAKNPYFVSLKDKSANLFARIEKRSGEGTRLFIKTGSFEANLTSSLYAIHHVNALLYAIAICDVIGFGKSDIINAANKITPELPEQRFIRIGKYEFYSDAYNSSPEAVIADFVMLSERKADFSAVLGDMLELGKESEALHFKIGLECAKHNPKRLYCFGKFASFIRAGALAGGIKEENVHVNSNISKPELTANAICENYEGETILLKASHSVRIERIPEIIKVTVGG